MKKGCLGCLGIYACFMLLLIVAGSTINYFSNTPLDGTASTKKTTAKPAKQPMPLTTQRHQVVKKQNRAKQKTQAAATQLASTIKKRKKAVEVFANFMNQGSSGQIFNGYSVMGDNLRLSVADGWYSLPKQVKIDRLKVFHIFWAKTCDKFDDPTMAKIKLESATGSNIGGWDGWRGYWVDDE